MDPFQPSMYTIELDSVSTIKKMLTFEKNVAFLSVALIEEELKSGLLVKKDLHDVTLKRKIQFIYPKTRLDQTIDKFVKRAIDEVAKQLKKSSVMT
jgi:hypothetical protein